MSEPEPTHLGPEEAKHFFEAAMEVLETLEPIGPNPPPPTSIPYMREQVAFNVEALVRGYYLSLSERHATDAISTAIRDPEQRRGYDDDLIMLSVFVLMNAFDRHDWKACIVELKALRLVMKLY